MYIVKNALRSIGRSKGRNILIGIIALVIAVSACIALSIKESAIKAREDTLNLMNITAQISLDRQSMMQNVKGDNGGEQEDFDRDSMKEMLQKGDELSLSDYELYATAESVSDSYYTLSATLNASGDLEPIDTMGTFGNAENGENDNMQMPQDNGGADGKGGREFGGKMGTQGDFTLIGYSGDEAMTDFVSGNCSIADGTVFDENTTENECIISQELATYNNLSVGSQITLANPNDTDETFTFTVVGIYTGEQETSGGFMGGFSTATDSANQIMTSYEALKAICDQSDENAEEVSDTTTGLKTSTAVQGSLNYTYVFADVDAYNSFADEVAQLGLSDDYTISSTDISEFENSLVPLENLSTTATYFLIVVFAIGGIILIVINIFNVRERKYEIGVLTAIGMKKHKVALQFMTELFVVTLAAIIVGAGIGAAASVPVTNALLSAQISSNQQNQQNVAEGFGRETEIGGGGMTGMPQKPDGNSEEKPDDIPSGDFGGFMNDIKENATNYISEISYSTDIVVILQLIAVGIGLTVVSSIASLLFIMRYEPLKILTNRD